MTTDLRTVETAVPLSPDDVAGLVAELGGAVVTLRIEGDRRTVFVHDDTPPADVEAAIGALHPAFLSVDHARIRPDGSDTALVAFTHVHGATPSEVTFTANGAAATVALTDGAAELAVTSTTPGDTITVTVDVLPDQSVTITVEEA